MSAAPRKLLLALLLIGAIGAVSQARVFWRRPGRSHTRHALEILGARLAYETDVTVNGGEGRLAVYHINEDIGRFVPGLASAFDLPAARPASRSMWRATFPAKGATVTLLALDLPDAGRVVVFAYERPAATPDKPRRGLSQLPAFPGSIPLFTAEDHGTGMSIGIAGTAATPAAVLRFYASQLAADGWSAALPARIAAPSRPSLSMYLRGDTICCVQALQADDGTTTISLLYKSPGVE